jgi:type III pantothenate kinase
MNWLLDLGNTRLKRAAFDGHRRGPQHAVAYDPGDTAAALAGIEPATTGARAWLASVAPATATSALEAALVERGYAVRRIRTQPEALGVRIAYADPARLGVDRFLALLGAHARDDGPWLIASIGSAHVVDLLAADGTHHGGLIAPSPVHLREALAARFPVLAGEDGAVCDWAIDTGDAVASGAIAATAGLLERSRRLAMQRLGRAPTVLLTGGGAAQIAPALPFATVAAPELVLDGLARLAEADA